MARTSSTDSATDAPTPQPELRIGLVGVALRGVLMGIAEAVPGVSGGTIAFITGIYQSLVSSLASFGPESFALLTRPRAFFVHHNLAFLLALASGMVLGLALFARLMDYLITHHQPLVWAFFSGVILMSVWLIGHVRERRALMIWALPGFIGGIALMWLPQAAAEPTTIALLCASALAVCAWLLPAVSGSYVLLAFGMYAPVIAAVAEGQIDVLATVAAGCAIGLMLFARVLAWLLRRYAEALLSLLTGFMLGSVLKLWPWQDPEPVQAFARLLAPVEFTAATGSPAMVTGVLVSLILGAFGIWLLARVSPS